MRQQILGADKLMAVGISSNRENNASQNGEVVLATAQPCDGTVGLLMEPRGGWKASSKVDNSGVGFTIHARQFVAPPTIKATGPSWLIRAYQLTVMYMYVFINNNIKGITLPQYPCLITDIVFICCT